MEKITKRVKRVAAYALALVMIFNLALHAMPATVSAAQESGKKWIRLAGGGSNGGGHAYGNAGSAAPVLLLNNTTKAGSGKVLSMVLKPSDNWGVFHSYKDDNNWLYIGKDPQSGWYYQYSLNGSGAYPKISGLPDVEEGEKMSISISLSRETLSVTVNGTTARVTNQTLIDYADAVFAEGSNTKFGVKTNAQTEISFSDVTYDGKDCMNDIWGFCAERDGQETEIVYSETVTVTGTVTDEEENPLSGATVRMGIYFGTTNEAGAYSIPGVEVGTYSLSVSKVGYLASVQEINVTKDAHTFDKQLFPKPSLDLTKYDTIESDYMKVYIGENFPVVARYQVKSDEDIFFRGNETELNQVVINGTSITPTVTVEEKTASSKTYKMVVEEGNIDFDMKVKVSVEDNDLTWEVIELEKAENCVKIATIDIPELNLVSVDETERESVFAGARKSLNVLEKADTYITFEDGFAPSTTEGYMYAFLTNKNLSAGVFSNSEIEDDLRVERVNGADYMALTSAHWFYECGDRGGQAKSDIYTYPVSELPYAKVCIAGDLNEDDQIDWNDGAVAYGDIINTPYGSDVVKTVVNHRIAMNFGSMAPNPFLSTADSIKRVYLSTDGLPQSVILKGYGNEGHDSSNSEYADISEDQGGVEDFQDLIKIAHKYNTEIGIHVNAHEAYPEARSFCEEMLIQPFSNGWNWIDSSQTINKLWDLASGARYKRFVQLYDRINNTSHYSGKWENGEYVKNSLGEIVTPIPQITAEAEANPDNMDFIYLDVWYQNSWESRQIVREINSLGWRFTTEFAGNAEYDSTWSHWATDRNYGNDKGLNSEIISFLRNHQRDIQVLNHPSRGGYADNPLLGGFLIYGFEGWQADQDYNNYLFQTFNTNIPTKFLQHYKVIKWENYPEGESPVGNPEKEITLKNDEGDIVVVTRKEEQRADDNIERIITLNDVKVLEDVTYLIPWQNEGEEEKLYHWNMEGGTTSWELLDNWKDATKLYMYELSDMGRINMQEIIPNDGYVTLENIKAKTAYVLVKAESVLTLEADYGEADYVRDPSFNGYEDGAKLKADVWSGDIQETGVSVKTSGLGDKKLVIDTPAKNVEIATKITGLEPGEDYVAEVYVDNQSDKKAYLKVNTGEKETDMVYTERSFARNYVKCDPEHYNSTYDSKMQIMYLPFVAESTEADFILGRKSGKGATYFDDIRIKKQKIDNYQEDGSFKQNFESVTRGIYPFVISGAQGIEDQMTHLSQLNAPYTQSGWNGKIVDDVIEGNHSLKHHTVTNGIIYQTIPQNFRFMPGKVYTVEFDYQAGSPAFQMVIGDGDTYTAPTEYLPATVYTGSAVTQANYTENYPNSSKNGHVTMQVTGSGSGQTWIGLYQNEDRTEDGRMGQYDFILDNLVIREDKTAIGLSATELYLGEKAYFSIGNATDVVTNNPEVLKINKAKETITAIAAGTAKVTFVLPDGESVEYEIKVIGGYSEPFEEGQVEMSIRDYNTEQTSGEGEGNGIIGAIIDGNSDSYWHSQWSPSDFGVSESNPATFTVEFKDALEIGGLMFQQRNGSNGRVMKYSYILLDENGNEIESSEIVEVPLAQQDSGATVYVDFQRAVPGVKAITFKVHEGTSGFASMAEFAPVRYVALEYQPEEEEEGGTTNPPTGGDNGGSTTPPAGGDNGGTTNPPAGGTTNPPAGGTTNPPAGGTTNPPAGGTTNPPANNNQAAADKTAADAVINKIASLKNVTLSSEAEIQSIRQMYEKLTPAQKKLVTNLTVLTKAEETVVALKKEEAEKAEAVKPGKTFASADGVYKFKILNGTDAAFIGVSKKIKTVKIANTVSYNGKTFKVTSVANKALKGDTTVTTVALGTNVKTIGTSAFEGCTKLKKITLKNKLTSIGAKAFKKCTSLTKVTIPKNVTTIGKSAFEGCSKLATITIKATKLKSVKSKAFKDIKANAKIKVGKKNLKTYQKLLKNKGQGKKVKITK